MFESTATPLSSNNVAMHRFSISKSRVVRRGLVALVAGVVAAAAVATIPSPARAGANGFPAWPGSVSCSYGLPLVSIHMATVHGLNTTGYADSQRIAFSAVLYEAVNGVWQQQMSPVYDSRGWVSEGSYVQQWFLPSGAAVTPGADFYTFRLVGSRYVYVKYLYAWNDARTGQLKTDYTMVGPIQC